MAVNTREAMLATGITYRQLDYWTRNGWLRAVEDAPGSGGRREWRPGEKRVAALMLRLISAGFVPEAAHKIARSEGVIELAPGVRVRVWRRGGQPASTGARS